MYHFSVNLPAGFESAVDRTKEALAAEGFGVLTEIDISAALKNKLGVAVGPYLILGACNPPFAHRALTADPGIGVLLPCNVVVREEAGGVVVDFMDPEAVLGMVEAPGVAEVATEVKARLRRVADALV